MSFAAPPLAGLDAHAQTDPRISKLFAGRYILGRELGRGGMGAVYWAFDTEAMRRVALKRIEPRPGQKLDMLEQRFRREIRALAASRHSGTPWLLNCDRVDGVAFYTMEIIVGEQLRALLARERLTTVRALTVAIELGTILASVHAAGVVHRDVKPGNILIEAGDRVRLVDFGACAFLPHFFMRDDLEVDKLTDTVDRWATGDFEAVHTPGYSAPEVGHDDAEASVRNDIYSVCAITYEMVTGRPLFDKQALRDRKIVPEEFAPELAPLATLLARGASHEAFDRPRSMAELVQGLEIVRTGVHRAGASARRPVVTTLALTVAAAAVVFAGWTRVHTELADRSDPPPTLAGHAAPQSPGEAAEMSAAVTAAQTPAIEQPAEPAAPGAATLPGAAHEPAHVPSQAKASTRAGRRRALDDHAPAVWRCVALEGGVHAKLAIELGVVDGRVDDVTLIGIRAPMLRQCVREALRGVQLPGAAARKLVHEYKFGPQGDP